MSALVGERKYLCDLDGRHFFGEVFYSHLVCNALR